MVNMVLLSGGTGLKLSSSGQRKGHFLVDSCGAVALLGILPSTNLVQMNGKSWCYRASMVCKLLYLIKADIYRVFCVCIT